MMFHADLPSKLWVNAFLVAICLINMFLSSSLIMTSLFEKLFDQAPNYKGLRMTRFFHF